MKRVIVSILVIFVVWTMGVKPLLSQLWFMQAIRKPNKEYCLKQALKYDPNSTSLQFQAFLLYNQIRQFPWASDWIEKTIINNNGDTVPWVLWQLKGVLKVGHMDFYGAKQAFEKATWYNPTYEPARTWWKQADDIVDGRVRVIGNRR